MAAEPLRILAISGSLRRCSINTALLRIAARSSSLSLSIIVFDGIGELPLFNPDILDEPNAVRRLRIAISEADALMIASPEYAHGITGAMKNALDWMVGNFSMIDKPVAVLNTSPRAVHADLALKEVLKVMSARVIEEASLTFPIVGAKLDENQMSNHSDITDQLRKCIGAIEAAVMVSKPVTAPF